MARALTTALLHRLREAFPEGRAYSEADLASPILPPDVAHFLTRALRHRARAEAAAWMRARTSPWLDAEAEAVGEADAALVQALVETARFPPEVWGTALQQAATFVSAYLARPRRTLEAFVFQQDDEALPAALVRRRLAYFSAYAYLGEAAETYLEERGGLTLTRDRFRTILSRVDRHRTERNDAGQWVRLARPLFDLAHAAFADDSDAGQRAVPIPALRAFFGEKEALDAQQALEDAARRGADRLTEAQLRDLLARPAAAAPVPEPPPRAALDQPDLPDLAAASHHEPAPPIHQPDDLDLASAEAPAIDDDLGEPSSSRESEAGEWIGPDSDREAGETAAEQTPPRAEPLPEPNDSNRPDRDGVSFPPLAPLESPGSGEFSAFEFDQHDPFGGDPLGDDEQQNESAAYEPENAGEPKPRATPREAGDSRAPFDVQVPMLSIERMPREPEAEEAEVQPEATAQPRWQQFAGPRSNPYAPNYSAHAGNVPPKPDAAPDTTAPPRWQEYRQRKDKPLSDLERLEFNVLGPRGTPNRALYVQYLFAGQTEAYESTLQRLAQSPDWPAASRVIGEDVFRRFQVNIYSEAAVAFTNQVEARFRAS